MIVEAKEPLARIGKLLRSHCAISVVQQMNESIHVVEMDCYRRRIGRAKISKESAATL